MKAMPKALVYADALAAAERKIIEALPEIIEGLIAKAQEGDVRAAVYLTDRILGKTAGSATPPADDRSPPFSEEDFNLTLAERESQRGIQRLLGGYGAHKRG